MKIAFRPRMLGLSIATAMLALAAVDTARAQLVVPGHGRLVEKASDDFEDPNWQYFPNNPKGSKDVDGQRRYPVGRSRNRLWIEGNLRGHPDVVKIIDTPPGGHYGSQKAMLLQSLYTGTPGRASGESGQDDFVANVRAALRGSVSASRAPSVLCRVYLPPDEQWEHRSGASFGFRITLMGNRRSGEELEVYWPGIFIAHRPAMRGQAPSNYIICRGLTSGADFRGPEINQLGWWTLGMSVSPDGKVHFFAAPGTDGVTADDHIASYHCYGFRAQQFKSYFFDVFNANNGKSWTTPWVVDDCEVYFGR